MLQPIRSGRFFMLTTKEYYFQNENHEPSRYLGTREQISRRL